MSDKTMLAAFAPVKMTAQFTITDGEQIANVSYEFPPGKLVTSDDIQDAASEALEQVRSQLGDGFRFQGRHDYLRALFAERAFGIQFAVPGPDRWSADWAQDDVYAGESQ